MNQRSDVHFERLCDELYWLTEKYPESAEALEAVQMWAMEETVPSLCDETVVPLPPEQLRKMYIQPVWIEFIGADKPAQAWHWHLLIKVVGQFAFVVTGDSARVRLSMDDCGKTWLAYDRQPNGN